MPYLMRTPEEIFRTEGKDIYVIRFKGEEDEMPADESPARTEMMAWLHEHLPHTHVEPSAPSEYSGYIIGYFGDLRVDFSESDLKVFCDRWENPDGGSVDPRFQCYLHPYQRWLDKISKFLASRERPTTIGLTLWWSTPQGIFYHQIAPDQSETMRFKRHPCEHRDLWFNAINLEPLLRRLDPEELTYGRISMDREGQWVMYYTDPAFNSEPDENMQAVRQWFNLPPETPVLLDEW